MEDTTLNLDDERSMELSTIAAIYPEIKIDPSCPFEASLTLPVAPVRPLNVRFDQPPDANFPIFSTPPTLDTTCGVDITSQMEEKRVYGLLFLPSLDLKIRLPEGYPYERPPTFQIRTHPQWLSEARISRLLDDGRRLWEECGRDQIIFSYIDHLQRAAEMAFGADDCPDGAMVVAFPPNLRIGLLDFNIKAERERFAQGTYECGVCLEAKKGNHCHRLRCSHVFCVSCLQNFYTTCITEGDIDGVKCLEPGCNKEDKQEVPATSTSIDKPAKKRKKSDRMLRPSELLQIPLDPELVQRYVFLKRKKKLEGDKSTVYCPRQWCQGAARSKKHPKPTNPLADDLDDSDEEEEEDFASDPTGKESQLPPMSERVAICEDCGYSFCFVCRCSWHGPITRCYPPRRQAELSAEEKATEEYLRLYTSACPTCDAPCQKRMGCNHMICFKCRTHFCYLCANWIPDDNPYRHFNDINSECYNRLWDLEGGDGLNPEGSEALHRIPAALLLPSDDEGD